VALNNGQVEDVTDEDSPFARDYKAEAQDVTDEVVRAEITT
jgi:hypothetical protein